MDNAKNESPFIINEKKRLDISGSALSSSPSHKDCLNLSTINILKRQISIFSEDISHQQNIVDKSEYEILRLISQLKNCETHSFNISSSLSKTQESLNLIYNSRSWRSTGWLRFLARALSKVANRISIKK